MGEITLDVVPFTEKLAEIKAIRVQVFQVEQGVDPALEFDGNDEAALHLVAYLDKEPVGTARIRYLDGKTAKIERLAVLSNARGKGIGKQLMTKALDVAAQRSIQQVVVHAQDYIKGLYQQLGFEQVGAGFAEAGLPHVKMKKLLS